MEGLSYPNILTGQDGNLIGQVHRRRPLPSSSRLLANIVRSVQKASRVLKKLRSEPIEASIQNRKPGTKRGLKDRGTFGV